VFFVVLYSSFATRKGAGGNAPYAFIATVGTCFLHGIFGLVVGNYRIVLPVAPDLLYCFASRFGFYPHIFCPVVGCWARHARSCWLLPGSSRFKVVFRVLLTVFFFVKRMGFLATGTSACPGIHSRLPEIPGLPDVEIILVTNGSCYLFDAKRVNFL